MKTWYALIASPAHLLGGALLLVAPASFAQNSFNRWEAAPVAAPGNAPRRTAATEAATAAPADATMVAPAPDAAAKWPAVRSVPLRRGLGQRLRASKFSTPDAGFYEYAWQHLHYPESALSAGLSGQVMVRVDVSPAGDVISSVVTGATIQQDGRVEKGASAATGQAEMRHNAQELLWGLRFEPATHATQEEIPVRYVVQ